MADPVPSAPTGGDAPLSAPDFGSLQGDIASIEKQYEPKVKESQEQERDLERKAIESAQQAPVEAEKAAGELTQQDREMQLWLEHTPTRQAVYATSMHAAPLLSILTALGGKLTRLNGLQMLSAQNGIIQGLNQSSEQRYNEALDNWKSSYEAMRDHQQRLMEVHRMMLTAYEGRADAYQKAADAARRMTGDILDDKQKQIAQRIDTFKAQAAAWKNAQQVDIANRGLAERVRDDMAKEAKWKDAMKRASAVSPELKAQIAVEHSRWVNAKSMRDEIAKKRMSLLSLGDQTDPAAKQEMLARLDEEDRMRANEMDQAIYAMETILAQADARGAGAPRPPPGAPSGANPRAGTIARPSQAQLQVLQQHRGRNTVTFKDGSTWYMDANGEVSQISPPTRTLQ